MPVPRLLGDAAPACPCHHLPLQLLTHLASVSAAHKRDTEKQQMRLAKHVAIEHLTQNYTKQNQTFKIAGGVG